MYLLGRPSAASNTMRLRNTTRCAVVPARSQRSSVARCSGVSGKAGARFMPSTVPKPGRKYKAIGDHCTRCVPGVGRVGPPRHRVCHDRWPARTRGPGCNPRRTDGRCPATRLHPPGPRPRAVAGGPCALKRWCVARGGGLARCAGRRVRPCGAAGGLVPPAPVARDTRRVGPRRRAVPARG